MTGKDYVHQSDERMAEYGMENLISLQGGIAMNNINQQPVGKIEKNQSFLSACAFILQYKRMKKQKHISRKNSILKEVKFIKSLRTKLCSLLEKTKQLFLVDLSFFQYFHRFLYFPLRKDWKWSRTTSPLHHCFGRQK